MTEAAKPHIRKKCVGILPFATIGIAALSLLLLPFTGLPANSIGITMAVVSAMLGFGVGFFGLLKYSSSGLFHDDTFHMLGVLLSAGILVLALADIANAIALSQPENQVLPYMVSSARATALILWILGVAGYVRASNNVLGFAFPRLWAIALVFGALALILAFPSILGANVEYGPYESTWYLFFSVIMGLITASIYTQYYALREGHIGGIIRYLFLGLMAMYLSSLLVWYASTMIILVIVGILAIEGYILIGGFLICSQELTIDVQEV